jgi:predicted O-methyltransferase YrrM
MKLKSFAFTISTNSHLPQACALAKSYLRHNEESEFCIALLDTPNEYIKAYLNRQNVQWKEVSGMNIKHFDEMLERYGPFEMSCAMKPFVSAYFLKSNTSDYLVYFDADILIFGTLCMDYFSSYSVSITPHLLSDIDNSVNENMNTLLFKYGVYNAGFFVINSGHPESFKILDWWGQKLIKDCIVDLKDGKYVDQLWLNLMPVLFSGCHINKEYGYNVALWNFKERGVFKRASNYYVVENGNEKALVFFHFTGFKFNLQRFSDTFSKVIPSKTVVSIYDFYRSELVECGINTYFPAINYYGKDLKAEKTESQKRQKWNKDLRWNSIFKRVYKAMGAGAGERQMKSEIAKWKTKFVPPGHYYSPYVDHQWIRENEDVIFNQNIENLLGIKLNDENQVLLLEKLALIYKNIQFPEEKESGYYYYYNNQYFSYSDAVTLACMIIHAKPKRILEVGSGFSSAVMADINSKYFDHSIDLKFIEPYPAERLSVLLADYTNCQIIQEFVQNVDLQVFEQLESGDILFIDSSHVSKTYSDVNFLVFQVLPRLKSGVIVHVHDIIYPFEYPREWIDTDRAWNEAYLIRAFLQFNMEYEILLFTSFMERKYKSWYQQNMPICLKTHELWNKADGTQYVLSTTGQSIYIVRK